MQVNVCSKEDEGDGIFRIAVLISYPDLSLGPQDVGYVAEFEPVDGNPQVQYVLCVSFKQNLYITN